MLTNCIVYYNSAPSGENCFYSRLSYSCTTPLPSDGVGNITEYTYDPRNLLLSEKVYQPNGNGFTLVSRRRTDSTLARN